MGQAADFYVSYTSADRAWAEWIARQLEQAGYQVMCNSSSTPPRHELACRRLRTSWLLPDSASETAHSS